MLQAKWFISRLATAGAANFGSFGDTLLRLVGAFVALVLVLFLAWFVLRWMGKRAPGLGGGSSRLIQVLDRVSFGKNSVLMLVRVQTKVLLVAMSEHAIETLAEFDDPDGTFKPEEAPLPMPFGDALREAAGRLGLGKKADKPQENEPPEDDGSHTGEGSA